MRDRAKYWQRVVSAWEKSGLTQAEFCRRRDVKAVTFGWWKRKLTETTGRNGRHCGNHSAARGQCGRSDFVEVSLPGGLLPGGSVRSVPSGTSSPSYEIVLPGGPVIRLADDFDPDKVSELIYALSSAC